MRHLFSLAALVALQGCSQYAEPVEAPLSWKRIDVGPFAFWAPSDVVELRVHPVDSYVREFKGVGMALVFDYGHYSSDLGDRRSAHYESVGGRLARFVSFDDASSAGADVAIYPHWESAYFRFTGATGMRLTFQGSCQDVEHCRALQTIYRTVRFK